MVGYTTVLTFALIWSRYQRALVDFVADECNHLYFLLPTQEDSYLLKKKVTEKRKLKILLSLRQLEETLTWMRCKATISSNQDH